MAAKKVEKSPEDKADKPVKPKRITKAESAVAPRERRSRVKEEGVLPKPKVTKKSEPSDLSDIKPKAVRKKAEPKAAAPEVVAEKPKRATKPKAVKEETSFVAEKPSSDKPERKSSDSSEEQKGWVRPERVSRKDTGKSDGGSEKPERTEKPSFSEGEKKPYSERSRSDRPERKFSDRGGDEKKSWSKSDKPYGDKKPFEKGSSERSGDFKRKSFDKPERKFSGDRSSGGDSKPNYGSDQFKGKNPLSDPERSADYELKPEKGSGGYKRPERRNIRKEGFAEGKKPFAKSDEGASEGSSGGSSKSYERKSEGEDKYSKPKKQFTSGSWRGKNAEDSERPSRNDKDSDSGSENKGRFSARDDGKPSRKESFAARRLSEKSGGDFKKPYERKGSEGDFKKPYERKDSEGDFKKPYERRGAEGEFKKPYERKDSDGDVKKPYERRGAEGDFKKPYERKGSDGDFKKPYERKDSEGESKKPYGRKDAEGVDFKKPYERRDSEGGDKYSKPSGTRERKPKGDAGGQDWEKPITSPEFISGNKSKTFRPKKAHQATLEEADGKIRLNKYISNSGVCSRREADTLIQSGAVKVNGKIVTELGTRVSLTDKIQYGEQTLNKELKRYLLLNKPKDYITTASDPEGRKTVMDLVKSACKERLYPVGRLDRATTGLLLLTNDGELAKKLTHPSHEVKKIYHVSLDKSLKAIDMKKIVEGLVLEDGKAEVDEIAYVGEGKDKAEIGIALHTGKNRIVRRIFEHLGYEVVKLDRTYFAGLTKKDLPRGRFRFLTEKEVIMLRMS